MADFDIDMKGLNRFTKELDALERNFPKQAKQLMMRSGSKARTIIARKARQLVKKHTGYYLRSIRRGKVWADNATGEYKVRVYTYAPHAHLIEYGHRVVGKDGSEHGFQHGYRVFEKATREIEKDWDNIIESEFDKIMSKL